MRANDFVVHNENKEVVQEDKERLDEILPAVVGAVWLAGMGWTAWDTWKNIQAYKRGEISGAELTARIGTDAALTALGGAAGKLIGTGVKAGIKTGKAVATGAKAAKKAATTTAAKVKQGINVVTGKPLKAVPKKPRDQINVASQTSTKAGQAAGATASKGSKIGQAVGANARKAGEKILKNPGKTGMGITGLAMNTTGINDKIAGAMTDKLKSAWDSIKQGTGTAGDVGDGVVYFGKEKNPPMKKVVGVNDPLYTKPVKPKTINSKTMDSNSPVPTAKDPNLPKQNNTSLSTQPGVK